MLLVLGVEVVQRRLGLRELRLVHALAAVPVNERTTSVHLGELVAHPSKRTVGDRGVVGDERGTHAQSARRYVAHRRLCRSRAHAHARALRVAYHPWHMARL